MDDNKLFQLHLAIAIEAKDGKEAFEKLTQEITLEEIRKMILASKDKIENQFNEDKNENIIIN